MKAADYLMSRGWWKDAEGCGDDGEGELEWIDPQYEAIYPLTRALVIQRARDATEERAAWVAFAAARLAIGHRAGPEDRPYTEGAYYTGAAVGEADAMLTAYRARFAVEVEP